MRAFSHVVFSSAGNDSVAAIQYLADNGYTDVAVVYSDTGWASDDWEPRVTKMAEWVESLGYPMFRTEAMGMMSLVRQRKGWPGVSMQFCTQELKIKPALALLDQIDPDGDAICVVGVRRCESQKRRNWPEFIESSDKHGGRALWAPLVNHDDEARDALVARTPIPLFHWKSRECFPCIYANKMTLRELDEGRIALIAELEKELGFTSAGAPRVMFRPTTKMGAVGIREVVRWAHSDRGQYQPNEGCDSGYCGD